MGVYSLYTAVVVCAGPWEEHETVFESRAERAAAGRAVDADFMPLSETPKISALVFGRGGELEAGRHASWQPANQSVSRKAGGDGNSGGDGGGARVLPRVAGGSAPAQRNSSKAHGSPKHHQQQVSRFGPSSVATSGTGPPSDPFYSQVGRLLYHKSLLVFDSMGVRSVEPLVEWPLIMFTCAGSARSIRCACTGEVEPGGDDPVTLVWERTGSFDAATQKVRILHDALWAV